MAAEVVLISASVFLGLAGQQWLEYRQREEQARDALRRFRTEITFNREQVTSRLENHLALSKALSAYLAADIDARKSIDLPWERGMNTPFFQKAAWELALATEALAYIDEDVAFGIAGVYQFQEVILEITRGVAQAMYRRGSEPEAFVTAAKDYYGDLTGMEPLLVTSYDAVLASIDEALAE
jgi:hypothetical protein